MDSNLAYQPVKPAVTKKGRKGVQYCAYLPNPELHTNSAISYAGIGDTPNEAAENCCYWANQAPFVVITPISRTPQWAIVEANQER